MAIAVASSSGNIAASNNVTITKPTGLAVGDLMVAILGWDASGSFPTMAGWTSIASGEDGGGASSGIGAYYKVADSGDVAASDFTATGAAGGSDTAGIIYRITGYNTVSPIAANSIGHATSSNSDTPSIAGVTTAYADSLLLVGFYHSAAVTGSGYAVANNNPTWTEAFDSNNGNETFASAYAAYAPAQATGNFSATFTAESDAVSCMLIAVSPRTDATGNPSLVSKTPTKFAPTGSAGTFGTAGFASTDGAGFAPSGNVRYPTTWTVSEGGTDTWTLGT